MAHPNAWFRKALPVAIVVVLAAVLVGCGAVGGSNGGLPSGKRTLYVTAMEFKGSAEVAQEPFPTAKLDGAGWILKPATGTPPKWEAESYAWSPATLVAVSGDEITFQVFGVNGAKHETEIEGHNQKFTVKRGEVSTVNFKAGDPGIYRIVCRTHAPSMTGHLVVLPKE